jgi:hypothetical protein
MAKFSVDLTQDTPDTLDRGRDVEPGWYRCDLNDVYDDAKSGATVFEYKVLEGKYKGAKIFDRISDPALATNDNAAGMIMRRVKLLGSRLGLLGADACGQQKELDFVDAIGQTVVVHVERRKYQDQQGHDKEITSVKFDGVYALDHERLPEAVRKELLLPPARKTQGAAVARTASAPANGRHPPLSPTGQAATQATPPATVDVTDL